MKKIISVLSLVLFIVFSANSQKNFIDQNFIEVVGKAEMQIIPDKIYLKIVISEKDNKNKLSITELENKMVDKLKEIGVDVTKDLVIKDLSSNFKYYLLFKNDILLTKEYQVLVYNGKTASRVFLELEKIGISNISVEKLDHSNMLQFTKEVKVNAIKAAKEKAELLTSAINQNIGRAIYIDEIEKSKDDNMNYNNIRIRGISSKIYGSNASVSDLNMEFEKIEIECSIICRFELK